MKALTVRQPWASLIVHGPKWIETRTRTTNVRGRIGIIAGMHRPQHGEVTGEWTYHRVPGDVPITSSIWRSDSIARGETHGHDAPRGALIGTVELYDCVPIVEGCSGQPHVCTRYGFLHSPLDRPWPNAGTEIDVEDQLPYGDFTPGRWAWLLRDPQPLAEPIPMRGALGWQEVAA